MDDFTVMLVSMVASLVFYAAREISDRRRKPAPVAPVPEPAPDWALREAMEELDAMTPTVPPMAPPTLSPILRAAYDRGVSPNSGIAMMNEATLFSAGRCLVCHDVVGMGQARCARCRRGAIPGRFVEFSGSVEEMRLYPLAKAKGAN